MGVGKKERWQSGETRTLRGWDFGIFVPAKAREFPSKPFFVFFQRRLHCYLRTTTPHIRARFAPPLDYYPSSESIQISFCYSHLHGIRGIICNSRRLQLCCCAGMAAKLGMMDDGVSSSFFSSYGVNNITLFPSQSIPARRNSADEGGVNIQAHIIMSAAVLLYVRGNNGRFSGT
ncbi:hypothetical protein M426DRAFT_186995 [Hypoxylon sp. CI-4A]|nr:hypothetical protein M426DRAFT_186995 [Hypoxylon sp. CI-4A]